MKNTCMKCKDSWNVNLHFAKLDETDLNNIENYGQLFSICEDCSSDYECESVEKYQLK